MRKLNSARLFAALIATCSVSEMKKTMLMRFLCVCVALALSACDLPPMDSTQQGFRGTAMAQISNPEDLQRVSLKNQIPSTKITVPPAAGPKASVVYKNVEVLGELSVSEFVATMTAMTAWVSPEQGCNYCHVEGDLASDDLYTKVVARRMLEMTQQANSQWSSHTGETGVTCFTCHRGNPLPRYFWFEGTEMPETAGMAGGRNGQNLASRSVGDSSLPYDPFSSLLNDAENIEVASSTTLPTGGSGDMVSTEKTYGLMMHMSTALGVNCTYCHNSRSFREWDQSNPARATAWHGIRMARDLNKNYLEPLQDIYPSHRLGTKGDAPKLNCETCHQGVSKPLYGENMLDGFLGLKGKLLAQ